MIVIAPIVLFLLLSTLLENFLKKILDFFLTLPLLQQHLRKTDDRNQAKKGMTYHNTSHNVEEEVVMVKADSEDLNEYLVNINATFCHFGNLEMEARWDYITDITTEHENEMVLT